MSDFACELQHRDMLETEICCIRGIVETVQSALTNPEFSPVAIHETLDAAITKIDNVKSLLFGPTPT